MLSSEYDLYAIVHHVGRLGDGHYIATVLLDKIDGNDDEDDVANTTADSRNPLPEKGMRYIYHKNYRFE